MLTKEVVKKLATDSYERGADDSLASMVESLAEMKAQGCEAIAVDALIESINTNLRGLHHGKQ